MTVTITRKLEWDSGHRVLGHEGQCRFLHGHRYVAEITVAAFVLDTLDRVIDFGVVKQVMKKWIDENWDHNMLLNSRDPLLELSLPGVVKLVGREPYVFQGQNPTAEIMAQELFAKAVELLPRNIEVVRVCIWETPNCYAEVDLEYPKA